VLQTFAWGLNNPFAVASKTHMINDILCYEAQLINAVIQSSGVITGHFHYEYRGDGGSLECRVGGVITGDTEITWGEWLPFATVTVKNSPLWKTNPKQQLGYLQVKNWGRAFYPGAIMGVYSPDEMFDGVGSQYDGIKAEDLSTPEGEVLELIEKIKATTSLDQLDLIKSEADLVKGEIRKRVIEAFRSQKKALKNESAKTEPDPVQKEKPEPAQEADGAAGTIEIDNVVIIDDETGEVLFDEYTDLRVALDDCATLSDLARFLKDLPQAAREALKADIQERQVKIKESK